MPRYIASYDLHEAKHEPAFTRHAEKLGWQHAITSRTKIWHRLPRTTLFGTFNDIDAALLAFDAIAPACTTAVKAPVAADKVIIVEYSASRLRSNEKRAVK